VQRILVGAVEFRQRPQHAAGQAGPQYRALRVGERAPGVGSGDGGGGARTTERLQLVGEQVFQALAAAGEESHRGAQAASERSSAANASAQAGTCADRRWSSSTSCRRALRGRAQATTSAGSISSSCQPCTIEVGTAAASIGGASRIRTGGASRNSP